MSEQLLTTTSNMLNHLASSSSMSCCPSQSEPDAPVSVVRWDGFAVGHMACLIVPFFHPPVDINVLDMNVFHLVVAFWKWFCWHAFCICCGQIGVSCVICYKNVVVLSIVYMACVAVLSILYSNHSCSYTGYCVHSTPVGILINNLEHCLH